MNTCCTIALFDGPHEAAAAAQRLLGAGAPAGSLAIFSQSAELIGVEEQLLAIERLPLGEARLDLGESLIAWVPSFGPLVVLGRIANLMRRSLEGQLAVGRHPNPLDSLRHWNVEATQILGYEAALCGGFTMLAVEGELPEVLRFAQALQHERSRFVGIHGPAVASTPWNRAASGR